MSIEPHPARLTPLSPAVESEGVPSAERSGPAIISLLQQAADVARRNEDRVKAMNQRLMEDMQSLEQRNQILEARVRELHDRALKAEQWLLHIYDEIHLQLIEHAPPLITEEAVEERRRAR